MNAAAKRLAARARQHVVILLKPRGKLAFLASQPDGAKVLDVGCGNDSPREFKTRRPDIHYTGLDVGDYNQPGGTADADGYIVVSPADFASAIRKFSGQMDAVVSAHNLEHCDDPDAVLDAMLASLRPGGCLYLAFPCEESVGFPRRRGTLNFFDDPTHKSPPSWERTVARIRGAGFSIEFSRKRYRPWLLAAAGVVFEPLAATLRRNIPDAVGWALYGFESIIWATRPGDSTAPLVNQDGTR